jgi:hypothetical protein
MYEAIAKAAEIIVRGRCQLSADDIASPNSSNNNSSIRGNSNNTNTTNNNNNNSTSRFNLELPPIASVRSKLQMWKTSLHVPLRLDVYYEYCTDPTDPEKNTRKELLERWCIDYIPSYLLATDHTGQGQTHTMRAATAEETPCNNTGTSTDLYHSSSSSSPLWQGGSTVGMSAAIFSQRQQTVPTVSSSGRQTQQRPQQTSLQQQYGTDETIAQLRQVVKRIVIQLRVLWSMTRMMPAYQLYDALLHQTAQEEEMSWNHHSMGYYHGQCAPGGGYYHQQQQQQQQPPSPNETTMHHHTKDLVGGKIHFSFHVSNHLTNENSIHGHGPRRHGSFGPSPTTFCQETLFSCTTNTPFQRYDLTPIPTPFGVLYMTGLYDDTLNVGQILAQRQRRLAQWGTVGGGGQYRSMPVDVPVSHREEGSGRDKMRRGMGEWAAEEDGMVEKQNVMVEVEEKNQWVIGGARSFPHPVYGRQMSMPSPKSISSCDRDPLGASPRVVSEHFVRNVKDGLDRPKSAEPGEKRGMRERNCDDLGGTMDKKKLSGLSLALLNEENKSDGNGETDVSSTGTNNENMALMRQRMAFHHPPPSFEEPSSFPHSMSASPQQQQQQQQQPISVYGYGYNNGNMIHPMNARRLSVNDGTRANSPSPNIPIANTPPQPMFIGSLPHRTSVGSASKNSPNDPLMKVTSQFKSEREDEVPFRNPTSLQKPAVVEFGSSTLLGKASVNASKQSSMQVATEASANATPTPQYGKESLLPPVNALDALATSPFRLTASQNLSGGATSHGPSSGASVGLSAFSSLVMGKGSAAYGRLDEGFPLALSSGGGTGFASSLGANRTNSERISHSMIRNNFESDNVYDDMPFAVDMDFSTQSSVGSTPKVSRQNSGLEFGTASSSTTMSSQVVTSLAHKCSTAGKLKLFNRSANYQGCGENSIIDKSFVEEQLNDFRSFGESITSSAFLSSEKQ